MILVGDKVLKLLILYCLNSFQIRQLKILEKFTETHNYIIKFKTFSVIISSPLSVNMYA